MDDFERFNKLVDDALELNFQHRERFLKFKETMSDVAWTLEFCTIKLHVGRSIGKSTYIKNRAHANDIIIVPNMVMADFFGRQTQYNRDHQAQILAASQIQTYHLVRRGLRYDKPRIIFIDEPSMVFQYGNITLPEIVSLFSKNPIYRNTVEQTYILLGA